VGSDSRKIRAASRLPSADVVMAHLHDADLNIMARGADRTHRKKSDSSSHNSFNAAQCSSSGRVLFMSAVDVIDILYTAYAVGVVVFIAYFAYSITKHRSSSPSSSTP